MEKRITSYFSNTTKVKPACIIRPESAGQVSEVVKTLVSAQQKFAVRSGGHAPLRESNNINGGVTLDFGSLNGIRYDANTDLATFGPGVCWKDVYQALQQHGRIGAGGREDDTGVAGFLLGGGNTWYTAHKGFGCDNVVSYKIQNGSHKDLFRVLKGGSNNFGIVVGFTMMTFPSNDIWGGTTLSSKEYIPEAIRAISELTTNFPENPHSSLIGAVNYIPQFKDIGVGAAIVETRGVEDALAFARWEKLPKMVSILQKKLILAMGLETALPYNMFDTWFTSTVKNDVRIMEKAVEVHEGLVNDLKSFISDGEFLTQCLFQPLPMNFAQRPVAVGGNVLGIERNKSDGLLFQLDTMVNTSEQNNFAYQKVNSGVQAIKEFAATIEGGLLDWVYLNYADQSYDPLGSYGIENVNFMKGVAATYDPKRVFQQLFPGGFKLHA
ncbi:hypothetical protein PFICI_11717 [Pestalotiopsis fici W106-1]|uniref:FAD-binding PCMH-type domain-containing protein n=1 Tax=Pestalotiopsis fici (strain W106-1 / CGMCC3.15140) TaxID=1229662 RepID=W3WR39_PESFW|nr:uncharacterized protein PFICI_11717 [Pestalotiopsis fici W106-1]ETS76330.1 hypothetical protein PFICI_11717 [Pestalotiopsis fici W106-1]